MKKIKVKTELEKIRQDLKWVVFYLATTARERSIGKFIIKNILKKI